MRGSRRGAPATAGSNRAFTHQLSLEDYERTLRPALIDYYEQEGYCWVISGSTESGRAFADPGAVPQAIAYYKALAERGEVVYRASPYAHGQADGRGGRKRFPSTSTGASTTTRSPTAVPGR